MRNVKIVAVTFASDASKWVDRPDCPAEKEVCPVAEAVDREKGNGERRAENLGVIPTIS